MTQGPPRRAPDPTPVFSRTGTPDGMGELNDDLVDKYIAALEHAKSKPVATEENRLRPEDVRFLAYVHVVDKARRGKVLSEADLRLLAAALGFVRPSIRAMEELRLPRVEEMEAFLKAADIVAAEPDISTNRLARRVGVSNDTIKRWRKDDAFVERVRTIRTFQGEPDDEHRAIAESWQRAREAVLREREG